MYLVKRRFGSELRLTMLIYTGVKKIKRKKNPQFRFYLYQSY